MGTRNKRFGLPWITACVAASLLAVMTSSGAQETAKKNKAERTESAEQRENGTVTAHLTGDQQVPRVETKASGKSTIKVDENGVVTGKVTVQDMTPTMAHIHQGPPDKDGPVAIPLKQTAARTFMVPANTKLTDAQFAAFKEGNLYINVHSKKYPSGEVRAQMKP